MNKYVVAIFTILLLWIWLLSPVGESLAARSQSQEQPRFVQSGEGPTDPAELEAFLDKLVQEQMDEYLSPGPRYQWSKMAR